MESYQYESAEQNAATQVQSLSQGRIPVRATITIPQEFTWSDNLAPEVEDFVYDTAHNIIWDKIMSERISFEKFKSGPMRIKQIDPNNIKASGTFIVAYEADWEDNVKNIQIHTSVSSLLNEVMDIHKFKYKNPNFPKEELENTEVEIEIEVG